MTITRRGDKFQVSIQYCGVRYRKSFPSMHRAHVEQLKALKAVHCGDIPDWCTPVVRLQNMGELLRSTYNARWAGTKSEDSAYCAAQSAVSVLGTGRRACDIGPAQISNLVETLRKSGNKPATINRKLAALSALLQHALSIGSVESVPTIKYLKEPKGRVRWLSTDEEAAMLRCTEDHRMVSLFVFLVETGVRRGEALSATWSQLQDDMFTVKPTKGGTPRSIPLTTRALRILPPNLGDTSGPYADIRPDAVNRAWNKAKAMVPSLAQDPEVVPHCLRHTCASRLVQRGANLRAVQLWLGHATINQTMVYSHLAPGHLDTLRDLLETGTN